MLPCVSKLRNAFLDGGQTAGFEVVDDFEPQTTEPIQAVAIRDKFHPLYILDVEQHDIQSPGRCYFGVQLAHGASGGIPRIGKWGISGQFPLLVELLEGLSGHIHFAPDNERRRRLRQFQWNRLDSTKVFCHILPYLTIPSGRTPDKYAVFILQSHGKAIHLRLQ